MASLDTNPSQRNHHLKPNYQFEKRQRELEKQKKKALKALKKGGPAESAPADAGSSPTPEKTR
ncbi:MAG: hypothetical protein CVV12_05540 [Gammaproteobacteria bacterium HGW-Gammaproteobacteria-2]|nr:MAG: hypothetical protein CVV12_05540 [Gammaproteobacteria bacterium HGW-Gammaproteobacteria-2]